ncbi:bifunctional proline dehydrogenase/L-glutamate gamma-semialdehyde dehydrogenase PutA [Motilimonas cestriensis]|uniref:Bifunctional protein PutA n=1 Tax=Motilimonas cestriensis TaxID=2742685 RepID=A0ABS8WA66_9GAMM|nr:bifunctional proline dehydrogenase/L-glutamate gamma-semialdehyde dehydrogenase PutA [Motilimonas cestriensis]MCE2594476.1 bifunctional proline dehydrogenase/L-glutamate gamma-semialdehyde dehydrogenase PutA [Motilimonas cestriensis]
MLSVDDYFSPTSVDLDLDTLWQNIADNYLTEEHHLVKQLQYYASISSWEMSKTTHLAATIVGKIRADHHHTNLTEAFLQEYHLSSQEGMMLMCLAEALMRIPDPETADALIRDKLTHSDWSSHLQHSDSFLVNASTWGLLLTGRITPLDNPPQSVKQTIKSLVSSLTEPIVRKALNHAMRLMAHQFVMGQNITNALQQGLKYANDSRFRNKPHLNFDMLGETAITSEAAQHCLGTYIQGIHHIAKHNQQNQRQDSLSIKLSALHPRFAPSQSQRVLTELKDNLLQLLALAKNLNVAVTLDAEESERLDLSLQVFKEVFQTTNLMGWGQLGVAVQAYSKRALSVLAWLTALAKKHHTPIQIRLVKGAYWDSEIKNSQHLGLVNYPVFTSKPATDINYLCCARYLLSGHVRPHLQAQFATHNAHTVAAIEVMANGQDIEFQKLLGMGEALYHHHPQPHLRVYAPVGSYQRLLPYLVRRLLENSANSSFLSAIANKNVPMSELIEHPVDQYFASHHTSHSGFPLPADIFGSVRKNSVGINFACSRTLAHWQQRIAPYFDEQYISGPIIDGEAVFLNAEGDIHLAGRTHKEVVKPYQLDEVIGKQIEASQEDINQSCTVALNGFHLWSQTSIELRASLLNKLADKLELQAPKLTAMCMMEAGKTLFDAHNELRKAVDYCRYYASQGLSLFHQVPVSMPSLTPIHWRRKGQGVWVCISPCSAPLDLFVGQICAALVCGNTVIAKPAPQSSLIAYQVIKLMLSIGFPPYAIQLLSGADTVAEQLTQQANLAGIAVTGRLTTAQNIQQACYRSAAPFAKLIAETSGVNCMLVDSTALHVQVVKDALRSAFSAAGQRCSSLRILCVQDDVADSIIKQLSDAMIELAVGNPEQIHQDIGPIINKETWLQLQQYLNHLNNNARLIRQTPLHHDLNGYFIAPSLYEIEQISDIRGESFGPILHVLRYEKHQLPNLIRQINQMGHARTCAIYSRNQTTINQLVSQLQMGNIYVNNCQTDAAIGCQPFGGKGLSGTGPKSGGPTYLTAFSQLEPY